MSVVIVTGSSGLIGAAAARFFASKGFKVVGIDNDMRGYFFGKEASTAWATGKLISELKDFEHNDTDIRDTDAINKIFTKYGKDISAVIHTAAQPSHDWAAKEPITDFTVNANGTLVLLEATKQFAPDSVFIFTSTNKVYGDRPNELPLVEHATRWEIEEKHPYFARGIDEEMSIDQSKHSLFGASKVAADVLVQEYGRYFGMKTGIFRGGCLTGPGHSGAQLHGFLAYLMKCAITGTEYSIFGYKGKQVRDNIHSDDLVSSFWHFYNNPRVAEVYNMGGSRHSNCSMLEAINFCQEISGNDMKTRYVETNRIGDHIWYISDVSKFQRHYPQWSFKYSLKDILQQIHDEYQERSKPEAIGKAVGC
jgi:CDP-paratose 2-epimerase